MRWGCVCAGRNEALAQIIDLIRQRLDRRSDDMIPPGPSCNPGDDPPRFRIPIRRSQTGKDIHNLKWDEEILHYFHIPASMLPEVRTSSEVYGSSDRSLTGTEIPIAAPSLPAHVPISRLFWLPKNTRLESGLSSGGSILPSHRVEHDPVEIWSSQFSVMTEAMSKLGVSGTDIAGIGITNQIRRSIRSAVRLHCQTIAGYTGSPVFLFHTIVVSLWFVIPKK